MVRARGPGGGPAMVNFVQCDWNLTLPLDAPPELDKWGCGDDYWHWPMMAKRTITLVFWDNVFKTVHCIGLSTIDHMMDSESEATERERERMEKERERLEIVRMIASGPEEN